jgi:hypothetical protein
MISLKQILNELFPTPHWIGRVEDRTSIIHIKLDEKAYGNYNPEEVDSKIIEVIKKEVKTRCKSLESSKMPLSNSRNIGYKFLIPVVYSKGQKYYIILTVQYKGKRQEGNQYWASITEEALLTLMISTNPTDIEIAKDIKNHIENQIIRYKQKNDLKKVEGFEKRKKLPVEVLIAPSNEFKINLDDLMAQKEKPLIPDESSVDYEVRTDYRKGSNFVHNIHGKGKVMDASNGGFGDPRGKVDWLEVKFDKDVKPILRSGKLSSTRRISPVYTKIYFNTQDKLNEMLSEQFQRMSKLAGLLTENELDEIRVNTPGTLKFPIIITKENKDKVLAQIKREGWEWFMYHSPEEINKHFEKHPNVTLSIHRSRSGKLMGQRIEQSLGNPIV